MVLGRGEFLTPFRKPHRPSSYMRALDFSLRINQNLKHKTPVAQSASLTKKKRGPPSPDLKRLASEKRDDTDITPPQKNPMCRYLAAPHLALGPGLGQPFREAHRCFVKSAKGRKRSSFAVNFGFQLINELIWPLGMPEPTPAPTSKPGRPKEQSLV